MTDAFDIAILGSGPGGLSAAVTCARNGLSHILLERSAHLSDTIFKYQKGKVVMAHPLRLPLQSELAFDAGVREGILGIWNDRAAEVGINVRYSAEVVGVGGQDGGFKIEVKGGEIVTAKKIILAIGMQGNLRQLGVPGQDRPWVQYQLDDPDEYHNERIMVVGAGDAGIENALALADHNEVTIINRAPEFMRAKPGNLADIERACRSGLTQVFHDSMPIGVDDDGVVLQTPSGDVKVLVDRVIARVGAIPPRKFIESCGIVFPSADPAAVPELSETYESNVKGLYIIGALAGYTLIKQAINQGHEVALRLGGIDVAPADEPLLTQRFSQAFPGWPVGRALETLRTAVPMLSGLTTLQLREMMLDSSVHRVAAGATIFRRGDYTSSLFNIVEGQVGVVLDDKNPAKMVHIGAGEFFGELGLVSGRRRSATVVAVGETLLVESPRRSILRLRSSVEAVKEVIDETTVRRLIHTALGRGLPVEEVAELVAAAELKRYKANEAIITEGEHCDALYIIRSGSATVGRDVDGKHQALNYIPAGGLVGERGLLDPDARRAATVRAAILSEVVRISAEAMTAFMVRHPELRELFRAQMQTQFDAKIKQDLIGAEKTADVAAASSAISFLVSQGIGESTNALVIDESLCTRCNNCETACASTHGGVARLNREAGPTFASIHIPTACRHCEQPHCMSDCPVDAITRSSSGEVFINDTCIGCSNCANNCPYGVIKMDYLEDHTGHSTGLVGWLAAMLGLGKPEAAHEPHRKLALKCDLCKDVGGGPACVRACPTGAATRTAPDIYMALIREGQLPNKLGS
ncbi:MAG: 4Fe-4S dicluster protein [Rhodospirillales bacterium]|nr:4Fe-4S dicluster protein [Rhodospirillales bacterium]